MAVDVAPKDYIKAKDFDSRVDILPVADPNIFSMAQRITLAQTELQLATSNPQIHNLYSAYRKMYEALGVKNIDAILPPPAPVQPLDPALEHINALGGKPFQAFRGQDHRAHVTAHLNFMSTNMVRNNPPIMAAMQKNILEHISLMAQEQVELEFADVLQQAQQMQMMAQKDPRVAQQLQKISQDIEARKSVLIAELTGDFAKEEKEITSQFDADPLLKLKSREVDLRAMENERKAKEAEERIRSGVEKSRIQRTTDEHRFSGEISSDRTSTRIDGDSTRSHLPLYVHIPRRLQAERRGHEGDRGGRCIENQVSY